MGKNQINYRCSVLNNSNRAVGGSEVNWKGIRENSDFRFVDEETFYTVLRTEPLSIVEAFEVTEPNQIVIDEDTGIEFLEQDSVFISFKEYELRTITNIQNPGRGYKEGDILKLEGGCPSYSLQSGVCQTATVRITDVSNKGEVEGIKIENKGKYVQQPSKKLKPIGGSGEKLSLELQFKISPTKQQRERVIKHIYREDHKTYLTLDAGLPKDVTEGEISCNKWELYLSTNYLGQDKINQICQITRDLTRNYQIGRLVKNSQNPEIIVNRVIDFFDAKIYKLEQEIKELKNKN